MNKKVPRRIAHITINEPIIKSLGSEDGLSMKPMLTAIKYEIDPVKSK
jgi:hypothetical protein